MIKKFENIDPHGGLPLQLGPYTDFDMFYNPRVVGNILSSDPGTIKQLDTEIISDDYFKENIKKKRKRKRKIKKYKEFEGAGFGHTDYLNVSNSTSSGYMGDNQPFHNGSQRNISSTLPRGNWTEPTTIIIGFKDYDIADKYFLRKENRKKRKRKNIKNKNIKNIKNINKLFLKNQ
jgi:hypothetical protein